MPAPTGLNRRRFLAGTVTGIAAFRFDLPRAAATARGPVRNDEIEWLPAWRLRELIARGDISPVEVLEYLLRRIDTLDGTLGAFVTLDRDNALRAARDAEKAVLRRRALGPLHGVPVAIKQMVAVRGLSLEDGSIAAGDAVAVERLRDAGAVVVGLTCLAGPAAMLGEVQVGAANPWDTARVAGASSSGSAAAVAAGLCPVAIGSDGGGSTRLPSAWCGIVGLHPTVGRVPADHNSLRAMARTSWSASYGPMARDARDIATTLQVIAGPNWRHVHAFNGPPPDYLAGLDQGIDGLRLGWVRDFGSAACAIDGRDATVVDAVEQATRSLADAGAFVDDVSLQLGDWFPVFTRIAAELSAGALYPALAGAARAWDSLRGRESAPQWRGELPDALAERQRMASTLLAQFEHCDLLLSATSPRIAPLREEYADWLTRDSYSPEYTCLTGHMNLLGFPAISVPAGLVDGMPIGLQIIARPDDESTLLRAAQAFLRVRPFTDRPILGASQLAVARYM